jgi:hypothetical protein
MASSTFDFDVSLYYSTKPPQLNKVNPIELRNIKRDVTAKLRAESTAPIIPQFKVVHVIATRLVPEFNIVVHQDMQWQQFISKCLGYVKSYVANPEEFTSVAIGAYDAWRPHGKRKQIIDTRPHTPPPYSLFEDGHIVYIALILHKQAWSPLCFGVYSCHYCSKIETLYALSKKCGDCKKIRYCSVECQRNDWSAHKLTCKSSCTQPSTMHKYIIQEMIVNLRN